MTRGTRIRLWIFLVIGGIAIVNAGARYAGLTESLLPTTYSVTVHLKESGGLFERGEVTYRGYTVGRVKDLTFRTDGVDARLAIKDRWKIPADLVAEVHNRSAVGEQYLDLVPKTDSGPYLDDGAVIDASATTTPVHDQDLIVATDELLKSIDPASLTTVVDESAAAFGGAGDDIGRLLTNSQTILTVARDVLPATKELLRTGGTVLATQNAQSTTIRAYLSDLAVLTSTFANKDAQVGTILRTGTTAANELQALGAGLQPVLPGFLENAYDLSTLLNQHRDDLEETLVAVPWALASAQTPGRDGRAHFTFVGGATPVPCRKGYIPASDWKSPFDTTYSVLPDSLGCREPASVPRGVTVR